MCRDAMPVIFAACLILLAPATGRAQAAPPDSEVEVVDVQLERAPDEKVPDLKAVARDFLVMTNAFREKEKQPRLALDPKLADTARDFAEFMAGNNRYGHAADGQDAGLRANKHEYEFSLISENIGYSFHTFGFTTEELGRHFVEAWENSPGHRRNMLDPDVTEAGMGVARSEKTGFYYAVQIFARPRTLVVAVEIVNRSSMTISYRFADRDFTLESSEGRIHEQGRPADLTFEVPTGGKPITRTVRVDCKSRYVIRDAREPARGKPR